MSNETQHWFESAATQRLMGAVELLEAQASSGPSAKKAVAEATAGYSEELGRLRHENATLRKAGKEASDRIEKLMVSIHNKLDEAVHEGN